jgi:hypothetical protein
VVEAALSDVGGDAQRRQVAAHHAAQVVKHPAAHPRLGVERALEPAEARPRRATGAAQYPIARQRLPLAVGCQRLQLGHQRGGDGHYVRAVVLRPLGGQAPHSRRWVELADCDPGGLADPASCREQQPDKRAWLRCQRRGCCPHRAHLVIVQHALAARDGWRDALGTALGEWMMGDPSVRVGKAEERARHVVEVAAHGRRPPRHGGEHLCPPRAVNLDERTGTEGGDQFAVAEADLARVVIRPAAFMRAHPLPQPLGDGGQSRAGLCGLPEGALLAGGVFTPATSARASSDCGPCAEGDPGLASVAAASARGPADDAVRCYPNYQTGRFDIAHFNPPMGRRLHRRSHASDKFTRIKSSMCVPAVPRVGDA